MNAKKADISQIRKYLAGELDGRAMHQLEREAQDDPFLMDAIEGYSLKNSDQQEQQLDSLRAQLQQRISQSKVYRLPARLFIAVAASVLLILTLSYLLWPSGHQSPGKPVAMVNPKTTQPAIHQPDTLLERQPAGQQLAENVPYHTQVKPLRAQVTPALPSAKIMATATATARADVKKADSIAYNTSLSKSEQKDSLTAGTLLAAKDVSAGDNTSNPQPLKMSRMTMLARPSAKARGSDSLNAIKAAHPQTSWDSYHHYLKGRAVIVAGKAGTVRLSFTVDSKGQLDNFRITKKLSDAADKLAISIVKDGPPWAPDASGQRKTIHLKIDFTLQHP